MTMQDVIDFLKRYGRTLFAVLIVALPVLGAVLKEVKKSAEKRRALLDVERRAIDEMRRGSAAVNAPAIPGGTQVQRTASNELEEMARRRRSQIEQASERESETRQTRVQQTPPTNVPTAARRNVAIHTVPLPQRQTQSQQRQPLPPKWVQEQQPRAPQHVQRQGAQPKPQVKQAKSKQKVQRNPQTQQRVQQRPPGPAPISAALLPHSSDAHARLHDESETTHRLVDTVASPLARPRTGVHLTRMDWRKALLMREVLGSPLALRYEGEQRGLDPAA